VNYDWRNPERVVPWKPRHRFRTTVAGSEAAARYRSMMTTAQQADDPRAALERTKQEWASEFRVRSGDGILLEELATGATTLAELQPTLEACDLSLRDARGVLDRLVAAGLIESLEPLGAAGPLRPSPRGTE